MNERNLTSSTTERILAAAGVLAFAGGAAFVWYFNPTTNSFFPACPLLKMTGFACPGCGLTRGFHALFHGDVLTALDFNAMLPIFAVFFGYLFVALILIAGRGRYISFSIFKPVYVWAFLFISIAFFIARNIPVYPFTVLYP